MNTNKELYGTSWDNECFDCGNKMVKSRSDLKLELFLVT